MNATNPYYFFFSYSHGDATEYLERFFEDLRKKVADLKGIREVELVGFRDEEGITTGTDWKSKIATAVQTSQVLVCIYSPHFFSREKQREFCAKEFMAFLKRIPELRYEQNDGNKFQVRGARNILPVLWVAESDLLDLNDLPPYAVRSIQYAINIERGARSANREYKEQGMFWIAKRRRGSSYDDIVTHFARLIIKLTAMPLPPLEEVPDVESLPNPFWDPPEGYAANAPVPSEFAEASLVGPSQVLAVEVLAAGQTQHSAWSPYAGGPPLTALVETIAYERCLNRSHAVLDVSAGDFVEMATTLLKEATEKQVRPILFVHPKCLGQETWRAALAMLLAQEWRGGLIIPADVSDEQSVNIVETYRPFLQPPQERREWIVVRDTTKTIVEFRTAVVSVLDEILARIVSQGSVHRTPSTIAGPNARPRIANVLDTARS